MKLIDILKQSALGGLFAIAAIGSSVLGYWAQDRDLPVQSKLVEVIAPAYPGGKLLVRWQVFRDRACSATKQELILDVGSVRWILPETHFSAPPGQMGWDTFVSQSELPKEIPVGEASLRVSISYQCNPVHAIWPITNNIPDAHFTILPAPKK